MRLHHRGRVFSVPDPEFWSSLSVTFSQSDRYYRILGDMLVCVPNILSYVATEYHLVPDYRD